jgi:hypothetical protein
MPEQEKMSGFEMPRYRIDVLNENRILEYAYLEQLNEPDLNQSTASHFECSWLDFWKGADFDCEAFIKFVYRGEILGLIRFVLYPYPLNNGKAEFVEIMQIESIRGKLKIPFPVGRWLIWYAAKISMDFNCTANERGSVMILISLEAAIDYYQNKVKMEGRGWTTISPCEDGYAFSFSKEQAAEFCDRTQSTYGQAFRTS